MSNRLTPRQERFARTVAAGGSGVDAVKEHYGATTPGSAKSMASKLLRSDKIQKPINEILDEAYPNLDTDIGRWLEAGLNAPVGKGEGEQGWAEKRAFLQMILDLRGYGPVKKTAHVTAKIKTPLGALGGDS